MHCDAKKAKCHLKSLAKNVQSNGSPFESQVFCRIHWALNFGAKWLIVSVVVHVKVCIIVHVLCFFLQFVTLGGDLICYYFII